MTPQTLVIYAVVASMHVIGVAMLLALYRLVRGPTVPDRILALDTLFVATIAQLMLFGIYVGTAVYFEAALIIAMLGFVGTVVLSKYVKLSEFFKRLHGPTKASTLGVGCVLLASVGYHALTGTDPQPRELLITAFLFITAPISAHLMAKAALSLHMAERPPMPGGEPASTPDAVADDGNTDG